MGIVNQGIPKQIVFELAQLSSSTIFVETGTYRGSTTRWASNNFKIVHTIERSENLYRMYSNELSQIKGVTTHLGDSRDILPQIVRHIHGQRVVYWLDGHWSGGETAGEYDECPLLEELACLSTRTEDIILIDDARLFLGAPPSPHNASQWPTIVDIVNGLSLSTMNTFVQIVDDVIFIVPNEDSLRNHLVEYAQRSANNFWNVFTQSQQNELSFKSCFKEFLFKIVRRASNG